MGAKGELYTPDLKRASQNEVWFRYRMVVTAWPFFNIYNERGQVVKNIDGLEIQKPGEYTSRSRAVFWDRTNDASQVVAAGSYFVELVVSGIDQDILRFELP